jgi:hypothetical protein
MKTSVRPGVLMDASGLPRPAKQYGGQLRRRFLLRQTADLDVSSLPLGLQHLLLSKPHVLSMAERQRLVTALVARDLDQPRIALVLNLLGDEPHSDSELEQLLAVARQQRERDTRVGSNFSLVSVVERRKARGGMPSFVLRLRLDGPPQADIDLVFSPGDLLSVRRFRTACLRQADFAPVFKTSANNYHFQRAIAVLFDQFREAQHA